MSDSPGAIEAYDMSQAVGDIVGLVQSLGETSAIVVGHDLGAWVMQSCTMLRPELFRALVMLNTPVLPRGRIRPTDSLRAMTRGKGYHHLYFQQLEKPDRKLAADTRIHRPCRVPLLVQSRSD